MNKASRGDGIPVEQFQILKDDASDTLVKKCSKFSKLGFNSIQTENYRFRKGRGTRDQIAKIHSIIKKMREFQKNI